jgi:hypothetical protein
LIGLQVSKSMTHIYVNKYTQFQKVISSWIKHLLQLNTWMLAIQPTRRFNDYWKVHWATDPIRNSLRPSKASDGLETKWTFEHVTCPTFWVDLKCLYKKKLSNYVVTGFKNVTWLCTHLVVQAQAEFKFRLGSIHMLNNFMFTKFTYIQPWNMIFEDLYEDYWTIEALAKISWRLLPSYFVSRLLPCSF